MGDLLARAWTARAQAEQNVARSEVLTTASRLVRRSGSMVTRCAWCGRVALGRWAPNEEVPLFISKLDDQTTHGICSDCLRGLERRGQSRPLDGGASGRN